MRSQLHGLLTERAIEGDSHSAMTEESSMTPTQIGVPVADGINLVDEGRSVEVRLARSIYPLDAIYGASYAFIERCYLLLDAPDLEHVTVRLRGREDVTAAQLEQLAREFLNELLTQAWRQRVLEANRLLVQAITNRAVAGALGSPALPDFSAQFDGDAFDDPLGIAVPWEEKYGKGATTD